MVASRRLGAQMGVPEDVLQRIDKMHEQNDEFMRVALKNNTPVEIVIERLTAADFDLQLAWGFPMDIKFHTLVKKFLFKKQWYGRKFRCEATGEEFVIPATVYEGQFFDIGSGGIDVGRAGAYSRRIGNIIEVEG